MDTRRGFIKTAGGAFFIAAAGKAFGANAPSNRVRLAIVGCHEKGRGARVMRAAMEAGAEIACVCDVDSRAREYAVAEVLKHGGYKPRAEKDLRKVLEDKSIDGIISETPDHWHACSAILAMRAGKGVYVEKPCCFRPEEGELLVKVWKETGMTLQVGSQRRASKAYREIIDWVNGPEKPIGELRFAKCLCSCGRASIGHGKETAAPDWLDWDLWQGPAPRRKFRDNLVHYNWHWFRHWGTAESGNNAPHFCDVARWALQVGFPKRVTCGGGKVFPWIDDDFEWPDTFNMSFEFPNDKLIIFDITSRTPSRNEKDMKSGSIVYGEKGSVFFGLSDDGVVYDEKGKVLRTWDPADMKVGSLTNPTATLDVAHMKNFIDNLKARSQGTFVPADEGYMSSYLPLAANVALDTHSVLDVDPKTGRPLNNPAAMKIWGREYEKGWELA